jgi:hypothetical protein
MEIPMQLKRETGRLVCCAAILGTAIFTGCGGSAPTLVGPDPSSPVGLPTPSAPGPVNIYSGGQSPGAWSFTLDHTNSLFSYQPVTYPAAATTGTLESDASFVNLSGSGLAYEVPGRAAVLRPGSNGSPVFLVPQSACYSINGRVRFQYIDLFSGPLVQNPTENSFDTLPYGSIVASTDSTGKSWQFQNMQGSSIILPTGSQSAAPAISASGPASFSGTCAAANNEAAVTFSNLQSALDVYWDGSLTPYSPVPTPGAVSNVWVGPSGFFAADQSDPTLSTPTGASMAGVLEPGSPLSTSLIVAGQYLGFMYEAPVSVPGYTSPAVTSPVGFGQVVTGTSSTITGGIYPGDDVTGMPNSDTQISLGSQDTTQNGLYLGVTITVLDPQQNCANFAGNPNAGGFQPQGVSEAVNAQGYVTCTFPGVAVVGNPEGKYSIFISTYNWAARFAGVPMEIFLFQQ